MTPSKAITISLTSLASRDRFLANLSKFPAPTLKVPPPPAKAGVLVPICVDKDSNVSLLYTVRSLALRTNSGQVAFPGGKCDENESAVVAAMRETEEEIGIPRSRIDIWGEGPSVPGRNNVILITPVIGLIKELKDEEFRINADEVSEVFTVNLYDLCQPQNQFHTQFSNGFILPVYVVGDYKIWGITAYITYMVLSCLVPRGMFKHEWFKRKVVTPYSRHK